MLGLMCVVSPSALMAQDSAATPSLAQAESRTAEEASIVAAGGPVDREGSGFGGSEGLSLPVFELSGSDDQVVGTLAFGYTSAHAEFTAPDSETDVQTISSDIFKLGVEVAVPFNGTSEDDAIDFRNLGDEAEVTLSATWYGTQFQTSPLEDRYVAQSFGQCAREAIATRTQSLLQPDRAAFSAQAEQFMDRLQSRLANNPNFIPAPEIMASLGNERDESGNRLFADAYTAIEAPCLKDRGDEYIFYTYGEAAIGPAEFRRMRRARLSNGALYFLGGQASLGYETHDVLDRTPFRLVSEDRVGIDARLYGGIIAGDGSMSGRLSVGYARGFEAQDMAEYCLPDPSGTGQNCISGEDGQPRRDEDSYVSLEGRFALLRDREGRSQLAIAPEVTYRFEDNDFLIDVPIYFYRPDGGGLSGGIRTAYDTGSDDFSVRLFIGVPFSVWF